VAEGKVVVGDGLLEEAFAHLRRCGAGTRECVCYLSGPLAAPAVLDRVLHPLHTASVRHYEVDPGWLHLTSRRLAREGREIRLQVHTHPGRAYHSILDDAYPIVAVAGLLSLVLPEFACGPVGLRGAYLARLEADGSWSEHEPASLLRVDHDARAEAA
jgi:hypothetical protein